MVILILDDDKIPALDVKKWIGVGREIPTNSADIPQELQTYIDNLMRIPDNYAVDLLPQEHLSVHEFIQLPLLRQDHNIVEQHASKLFTNNPPNLSASCLSERSIPHKEAIRAAVTSAGQAILDGAQAI